MAKYGEFYYGSGKTYGQAAPNPFSIEPFIADAIWYNKVRVSWEDASPSSSETFTEWRLVRNQFAYSDTPDDGVTLAGKVSTTVSAGSINDTELLSSGKFVFYRFWLKRASDGFWVKAGDAETILPREHSSRLAPNYIDNDGVLKTIDKVVETTHDKLMSYLPKIFTTGDRSTDSYDPNGTLSKFLEGFSFTLDEFLTYTQLIVPGTSGVYTNEPVLKLQSQQFGVSLDPEGLTKTQKKLVRNAVYLYSRKGTAVGIKGFAEAITGYPATVTTTSNLLLSIQDATFYKNVGNWKVTNLATITATNTVAPPAAAAGDLILDSTWTAAVVNTVSQYGSIRLGMEDPIRTGIPVVAGTTYYLNFYIKSASASPGVFSMDINWFDEKGKQVADAHTTTGGSVTSSWTELSYNRTAPAGAKFAAINITFSNTAATYSIDRVQFYASNIATYSEPRAAYVSLSPTKYNYVKNPTFVSGGTAWGSNNATQTTPTTTLNLAPAGSTMLRLVTTAASTVGSPYLSFSSNTGLFDVSQAYTFSIYIKSSATRTLTIDFYATDTTSGGPGTLTSTESISVGTDWTRYDLSLYLTSLFTKANTNLFVKIYGGTATAATIEFDCAQIEQGAVPTDYFDGSLTSLGAGWSGTTNQSASYIYSNRTPKIARLNSEIKDFIPINTGYFVNTLLALEKSGITT